MEYFLNLEIPIVNRFILEQPEDKKQTCQPDKTVPLCRDRDIASYNNLFANTQALTRFLTESQSDNYRQDLHGLLFEDRLSPGGAPGTQIDIGYSRYIYNRWLFDPASDCYLTWIQLVSATGCSKNTSKGDLKSRHFLGRWLSLNMICSSSLWVTEERSRFLGIYWRIKPFIFSFAPRSQAAYG